MTITSQIRRELKQKAHHLKPVVMLGQKGLSNTVLTEINLQLEVHELIKIKIQGEDKEERLSLIQQICETLEAEFVGLVGHIAILYRRKESL